MKPERIAFILGLVFAGNIGVFLDLPRYRGLAWAGGFYLLAAVYGWLTRPRRP